MNRAEIEAERRREVGLPVLRCPNCGSTTPHWIPETLAGEGHYSCATKEES